MSLHVSALILVMLDATCARAASMRTSFQCEPNAACTVKIHRVLSAKKTCHQKVKQIEVVVREPGKHTHTHTRNDVIVAHVRRTYVVRTYSYVSNACGTWSESEWKSS